MSDLKSADSSPIRPVSPLLKADKASLHLTAEKSGTIRVTYAGWEDAKVMLAGERLEVRWKEGQVHLYRTPPGPPVDYRDLLKRYMRGVIVAMEQLPASDAEGSAALINTDLSMSGPDLAELQAIEAEVKA